MDTGVCVVLGGGERCNGVIGLGIFVSMCDIFSDSTCNMKSVMLIQDGYPDSIYSIEASFEYTYSASISIIQSATDSSIAIDSLTSFNKFGSFDPFLNLLVIANVCFGYECPMQSRSEVIVAQRIFAAHE